MYWELVNKIFTSSLNQTSFNDNTRADINAVQLGHKTSFITN